MPKVDQNDVQPEIAVPGVKQDEVLRELDLDKTEKSFLERKKMPKKQSAVLTVMLGVIAIASGIGTGFGAYKLQAKSSQISTGPKGSNLQQVAEGDIKAGDTFGIKDDKTFKDSAEGYLEEGNIDDEGSHRLLRPGGVSQTVFLTSSSTDLDKFIGMTIKVRGETFKGQKAGWLMDVGQVQVIEVDGKAPTEE